MGDEPTDDIASKKSLSDELAKLAELADRGVLTREEFERQKAALLQSASANLGRDAVAAPLNGAVPEGADSFTNADRLRILANLPPAKIIWGGVFFWFCGTFFGPAFLTVVGTAIFLIGVLLSVIKPTP